MVLGDHGPDMVHATPHHEDAEPLVIHILDEHTAGQPVSASPRADCRSLAKAVTVRQSDLTP